LVGAANMDVSDWLRGLGLDQYAPVFRENKITPDLLPSLTAEDLKELGVSLIGDRRRLLNAIAALTSAAEPEPPPPKSVVRREAERRQVTILFCDLVGSTALSARLDPEDLRDVIGTYHRCCARVIEAAGGFVAKYLGDGVLAYFGYPRADEHAAELSVRAGLQLIEAVGRLEAAANLPLRARLGIATGLVVIGDLIGEGSAQEQAVVGETPNLAARLQTLAGPDQIVLCDTTAMQFGALFKLDDLGWTELKGFDQPQRAWRVLGPTALASRSEALPMGTLTPLVGRDEELELLSRRWAQAKSGTLQVVLVSGEAGIGKSRLLAALEERLGDEPRVSLRYFCSARHQDSALHPIVSRWQQEAGFAPGDSDEAKLAKLEAVIGGEGLDPGDVALLAAMLSVSTDGRLPRLDFSPQRLKERTFALLIRRVVTLVQRQPVLMLLEDAHWADPSSLELFSRGMEQLVDAPVLLIISYRPEFAAPWVGQPHVTVLALSRLDRRRSAELVGRVTAEQLLSPELIERIVAQTDGMPLFIEELTKAILESATDTSGRRRPFTVPTTLQASLMARLDRLPAVKQVAQSGAVVGREFSHRLLAAIAGMPDPSLAKGLQELLASGLAFRRGVPPDITYVFKHALVRDVAYESLVRERRAEIHRRVIFAVESDAGLDDMEPALLGYHCAQAGLIEKAANYYRIAGQQSVAGAALVETKLHLEIGLRFAESLPVDTDRLRLEAELLLALGSLHLSMHGLASEEARKALDRAADLGRELDDARVIALALFALGAITTNRVELHTQTSMGDELYSAGQRHNDLRVIIMALGVSGCTASMLGEFQLARERLEKALALSDFRLQPLIARPATPDVVVGVWLGVTLASLGLVNRARDQIETAVHRARQQSRLSLAFSLNMTMRTRFILRDDEHLRHAAEKLHVISDELGLPYWLALSNCVLGWLNAKHGDKEAALDMVQKGLQSLHSLEVEFHKEWTGSALLSDVLCGMGRYTEAIAALDAGLAFSARTKVAWFEAELHRRKAELLLNMSNASTADAENEFHRAIDIARKQSAKLFELRAATGLARLWADRGRRSEARDLLKPIHSWFTEGLGSVDLQESETVLEAVS
jgi:class 3 adenylate cyclase/tetratricopeptide (TPR) repeat protein